jgi:tRNA threonylcarbamoyladenosine biosynthesis protein TsaE
VEPYEFSLCKIYHFDLYRLIDPAEVQYLGIDDYFQQQNICLLEWAERGRGLIPAPDLSISLSGTGTGREISCQTHTAKGERIAARL